MNHLNETKLNNQGCLMKIVEDNDSSNIVVEFQDEYKYRKHTIYANFKSGSIRNPYCPSIYGIGITGCKYPTKVNNVSTKEYNAWIDMLKRCFMENIELIKEQICDVCHKMWQLGWVAANDGNVSVKLPDGNFMATPTGISKSFITPEKLVIINAQGEVLEGAPYKPSSEIKMHLRCYKEREDVGAVVHAHPPTATGYAVAGKSLDEYSMIETVIAIGSIPLTPYGTPSTDEVPDAIAPYLPEHDVMLLQNHGALAVGCDLITAYYRMETLELFAKISLTAHLLGGAQEISRPKIDKLLYLRENYYGVTGKHPGYKHYNKDDE